MPLARRRRTRVLCPHCERVVADNGTVYHQGQRRFVILSRHKATPGGEYCPGGFVAID